jgi:ligand-binding sensor domain-containing protein
VVPRNATQPSAAQVIAGVNYAGISGTVTKAANGSGAMAAKTVTTFAISPLTLGTAYDLYLVAKESSFETISNVVGPIQFTTSGFATRSIVIDPATPAKVYSALDGSGVYRSTDSGANWTAATTQPGNLNVRALVIKPGSPATLFAASYGGGVFISTDSAATWAACATQPSNTNLLSLAMDATGRLYAGSEAGVFVSSNDGAAWTAVNTGLPP